MSSIFSRFGHSPSARGDAEPTAPAQDPERTSSSGTRSQRMRRTTAAPPPERNVQGNPSAGTSEKRRSLRQNLLPSRDTLYKAGFGIASKSASLTPLHTATTSAQPKLGGMVRREGAAAPTPPAELAAASHDTPRAPAPQSEILARLSAPDALDRLFESDSGYFSGARTARQATAQGTGGAQRAPASSRANVDAPVPLRTLLPVPSAAQAAPPEAAALAQQLDTAFSGVPDLFGADAGPLGTALGDTTVRRHLLAELRDVQQAAALSEPEVVLLAKTLDAAFRGAPDPATQSLAALRCLRQTDLLGTIRAAGQPAGQVAAGAAAAPGTPADRQKAWHLAGQLECVKGGIGMDLLDKLTPRVLPPAGTHASVAGTERMLLRTYLKATAHLEKEARAAGRRTSGEPAAHFDDPRGNLRRAIDADPAHWPGANGRATPAGVPLTIAEKALLAIKDALTGIDAHVANAGTRGAPLPARTHGCHFAIAMVRGGMTTDQQRNLDGTRSEFDFVESRSKKSFGTHLDRALQDGPRTTRIKRALLGFFAVNKNKSPMRTYDRMVSSAGADHGVKIAHRGGIHEGRAFSDMFQALETAIAATLHDVDAAPQNGADADLAPLYGADGRIDPQRLAGAQGQPLIQQLVREAILTTTRGETVLLPRFAQPVALSPRAEEKAAQRVLAQLRVSDPAGATAGATATLAAAIRAAVRQENQPLTPTRLLDWAAMSGGPRDAGEAEALARRPGDAGGPVGDAAQPGSRSPAQDWTTFAKAFDSVQNQNIAPIDTPPLKGMTRHEAAELLGELVRHEELGSGLSLSSAGNVQATTRNVSGIVSSVLSGAIASVRVDLGGGMMRTVSFDSATSTDRSTLRVGVSTLKRVQGGLGASVGHSLGHEFPVTLSLGGDVNHAYSTVHQEGVVFGFPRHLSGGVGGDRALNAKKAMLVKMLLDDAPAPGAVTAHAQPGNAEDRDSLVKRAYQAFGDELSIGRFEFKDKEHVTTGATTAGAGIRFGGFRLGLPSLRLSGQRTSGGTEYRETSGWLRTERDTSSQTFKASADGIATALNALPTIAQGEIHGFVQVLAGNGGAGGVDFFHCGQTDARTRILEDGKELPNSFATRAFLDPRSFVAGLASDIDQFSEDKAKKFFPATHADPASRDEAVAREKRHLGEFVGHYLGERDMTATPQIYWEFGAHVDRANLLDAEADLASRRGDTAAGQRAHAEIDAIHTDSPYREGRFLINAKVRSRSDDTGANNIGGLTYASRNRVSEQSIGFT